LEKLTLEKSRGQVQMTPSPLRYPGGKTRATKILEALVKARFPTQKTLISPFLGGGSFELHMKTLGYKLTTNDLFKPLYTFWRMAKEQPLALQALVKTYQPMTKEKFVAIRQSILVDVDPLSIAAKYFVINRSSFSGSTFCGGYSAESGEKRFTENSIKKIGALDLSGLVLENKDCLEFIRSHPQTSDTILFLDPPYYITKYIYGRDGDMHEGFNHTGLLEALKERTDWILCYNDCQYIRDLYKDFKIEKVSWAYGMNSTKESSEVIISPR
jgi:DNA adenine methylase